MMDIMSSVIDATITLLGTVAALGSGMVMLLSMSSTVSAAPEPQAETPPAHTPLKQAA
ncbi:hypothetical protein [Nitrospira sp. Nam74]